MPKFLRKFEEHSEYLAFTATTEFILPNVSICVQESDVHYNPSVTPPTPVTSDYLTFVAEEGGTFTFTKTASSGNIQYSKNGGAWTTDTAVTVANGDVVKWKGEMTPPSNSGIGQFSSSGKFSASGTPMSLLFGDNYDGQTSLAGKNYAFFRLFSGCTALASINDISIPATTLAQRCYESMFEGCTSLTSIPSGFLPATTLANYCYEYMFSGCTSLTTVPSDLLPATTLSSGCYMGMFENCTSLATAPELPATTLDTNCYYAMFGHCTSLTTAPDLLAPTLVYRCYEWMFQDCSSLNYIKCLATNITSIYCTPNWVKNVAASGTFIKANGMESWTSGVNGIPSGWNVQDA